MKMIIVCPDGEQREFKYCDIASFHHWLFACLAGVPKIVEIEFDEEFNEIYRISYV